MIGTINIVEGGREQKETLDYYGDKEASLHSMFPFLRLQFRFVISVHRLIITFADPE